MSNSNKYPGVYQAMSKVKDPKTGKSKDVALDGKWCLRLCYTVNGKTIRETETVEARTQKQAYDIKVRLIAERTEAILTGGNKSKAAKMDFSELIKDWKAVKEDMIKRGSFSPTTMATYESTLDKYIKPYFGSMIIGSINSATIYNYQDYINREYELSDKSIRNQLMLISGILTHAVDRGLIVDHPFDRVKLEKLKTKKASYFTEPQMINIMKKLDKDLEELIDSFGSSIKYKKLDIVERERRQNLRILDYMQRRLFVHLAIVTGSRRGELAGLTWNLIDLEDMSIEFNGTSYTLAGEQTKKKDNLKNGDEAKEVTVNSPLVPIIEEYKKFQKKVRRQNNWPNNGYVFLALNNGKVNKAGGPIRGDTFTHWFHDWCKANYKELGLTKDEAEEAHVHMLRHSSISLLINSSMPIKAIADRAGHSDVKVTTKTYAHVYEETDRIAANQFNKLYEKRALKTDDEAVEVAS